MLPERMVGTAYIDDEIWREFKDEYAKIPVLGAQYPTVDAIFNVNPDFLYGSYASAFRVRSINYTKYVGPCSLGILRRGSTTEYDYFCRKELNDHGIDTYLQVPYCENVTLRTSSVSIDTLYSEIWEVATVFDVHENARQLIDSIENHFEDAKLVQEKAFEGTSQKPKILWLDSWDDSKPFVGACCGSVNFIIEHAGGVNAFQSLGANTSASWDYVFWSEIQSADPDVIVLVDAGWDSADEKLSSLCNHSIARNLRAVQSRAFISVPFSGSTLGVKIGAVALNLAEAIATVGRGLPLSSAQFSLINISSDGNVGGEAISNSGVKVYTKFPTVNGVDLDKFCPGESNIVIKDPSDDSSASVNSSRLLLSAGTTVGIVLGAVAFAMIVAGLSYAVGKKKGYSNFQKSTTIHDNL